MLSSSKNPGATELKSKNLHDPPESKSERKTEGGLRGWLLCWAFPTTCLIKELPILYSFLLLGHLLRVMMMRSYLEVSVSLLFRSLSSNATIPCATTTSAKEQQHLYISIVSAPILQQNANVQARIAFCLCCPCCGIFMSLQKDWHTRQTDRSKQCLIVPDLDWPSTTEEACEM